MTKFDQLKLMVERATASASPYVAVMKTTVEGSHWHREENVWVHTQMVVAEYLKIWEEIGELDTQCHYLGGVAALFHDFGKPDAEEERTSEDRGTYRRYKGHEAISAGAFREVVSDPVQWEQLFGDVPMDLSLEDVFLVTSMVQHHLPYQYNDKLRNDVLAVYDTRLNGSVDVFFSLLRADARGRISDDHEKKLADVEAWIADVGWVHAPYRAGSTAGGGDRKYAYVLIGPSGSGKSTYLKEGPMTDRETQVFSMDDLRLKHYADPADTNPLTHYENAWAKATEDKEGFSRLTSTRVNEVVRSDHQYVFSDNQNLTKKSRRQFISAAKQRGRIVVGVVFLSTSLAELHRRGKARGDRGIPKAVLTSFFHSMHMPAFDEVDAILVV